METPKPKPDSVPVQATDRGKSAAPGVSATPLRKAGAPGAEPPSPLSSEPPPLVSISPLSSEGRQPLATLPDGVPSVLWEDSVESERYFASEHPKPR
jgi:hypothetical protein